MEGVAEKSERLKKSHTSSKTQNLNKIMPNKLRVTDYRGFGGGFQARPLKRSQSQAGVVPL
jgi:hypothetical protein